MITALVGQVQYPRCSGVREGAEGTRERSPPRNVANFLALGIDMGMRLSIPSLPLVATDSNEQSFVLVRAEML